RRCHLDITMLAGVQVEHETGECAHQASSLSTKERKPRTGQLRTRRQIQDAKRRPQFPMRTRLEVEARWLAPASDHPIGGRVPVGDLVRGEIGQREGAL